VSARAWSPAAGASKAEVAYDATTGVWEVAVEINDSAWTNLTLAPS
jgi:hypothetical protein